ncbi:MAG: glucose-6-phosphate dehydrogenase assembly protein OpcA [Actinomycetia bacterium]|nr:glucose-6-phosphate dehydrogenase assembly protein OpcA [Actinomycetes bacterium]
MTRRWQRRLDLAAFSARAVEETWAALREAVLDTLGKDPGNRPRARRLVLVTVARYADTDLDGALETAARRFPGRHIAVVRDAPPAAEGVDVAWFTPEGCGDSEMVRLVLARARARHWAEFILPLFVPGLVTYLYLRDPGVAADGTATALAGIDHVVLDTTGARDPAAAWRAVLGSLPARPAVSDLAWTRLTPWRQALAAGFDPPARRALLPRLERLEAALEPGATAWLVAWLASRLGLEAAGAGALRQPDGRRIEVAARPPDPQPHVRLGAAGAELLVAPHGPRLVATWSDEAAPGHERALGPQDLGAVLADTLAQGFDPVFAEALAWQTREETVTRA